MKRLLTYSNFLETLLERVEPKDNKLEDLYKGLTVAKKIVNFLKKHRFEYKPGKDSRIFMSFKTGNFDTIVPKVDLGGTQYSSPQGFYCFDMNVVKKRLFGDEEISAQNFSPDNLKKSSNEIEDLGLGYANNGNVVSDENIWSDGIPRWLYFVKVKDSALILSSDKGARFYYEPLTKFLDNYLHYFLVEADTTKFDSDNKKSVGSKKMSIKDYGDYFKSNTAKYKSGFVESLLAFLKAYSNDGDNLDRIFFNFIKVCSSLINKEKELLIFTQICQAIGVDGFTQRRPDTYIHSLPPIQTILLSDSCVEELMKVDLVKELPIDKFVSKENSPTLRSFVAGLKVGDVFFDRERSVFMKFKDEESFVNSFSRDGRRQFSADKLVKMDLTNNEIWQFISTLKDGDSIKIIGDLVKKFGESSRRVLFLPNINLGGSDSLGGAITRREIIQSGKFVNFTIDGKGYNKNFDFDLGRSIKEEPFFDSELVSDRELVYWNQNKEDLIGMGANWEEYSQGFNFYKSLEELKKEDYGMTKVILDDIGLLTLLNNFREEYSVRVFSRNFTDLRKESMTLLVYRGDLEKPYKIIKSPWIVWK